MKSCWLLIRFSCTAIPQTGSWLPRPRCWAYIGYSRPATTRARRHRDIGEPLSLRRFLRNAVIGPERIQPSDSISQAMKPESPIHKRRNHLLILVVVLTNVFGNVALSHGMRQAGSIVSASPLDYMRAFVRPWTVAGIVILVVWMVGDLALLSRADLSFVLPVTASAYVLIAIAGHFWLGERISVVRWLGIIAITLGVVLAEETPSRTTGAPPEQAP